MDILFIKLSAIGDVVQTLPALEAIKKAYPAGRITWVVEEAAAGILEGHPFIDRLLVSRRKAWIRMLGSPRSVVKGLGGILLFFHELRRTDYDIAIDFQGLFKSGIVMGFARAKRKIGFDGTREFSYLFLNERLPAYDREKHALERYLDVARHLGAQDPEPVCTLPLSNELTVMRTKISGIVQGGKKPLVVINPAARWETKLWTEQKFAELADRLITEKEAAVIFTGSRVDRDANRRILGMMRKKSAVDLTGETTLKELAAIAALSDLFITTDTGPMHLAAAAGAHVLALFGPTAPWRTGPYGSRHLTVRAGIECSPCFKRKCEKNIRCMRSITVQDVLSRIQL